MNKNRKARELVLTLTPKEVNAFGDVLAEGILRMNRTDVPHSISYDFSECYRVEVSIMNKLNSYIDKAMYAGAYSKKTLEHMCIKVEEWLIKLMKKNKKKGIKDLILKLTPYETSICRSVILEGLVGLRQEKKDKYYRLATNVQMSIKVGNEVLSKINLYLEKTNKSNVLNKRSVSRNSRPGSNLPRPHLKHPANKLPVPAMDSLDKPLIPKN